MDRKKQYLLFDLDGTLTDSGEGIINSVIYALNSYGIQVEDRKPLEKFIGPPLLDSFMTYYGFDKEKALEAVSRYREYFSVKGLFENRVYPGIPQMLEKLQEQGFVLMVATSKPEEFMRRILDHFDLTRYFAFLVGATMDGTRSRKSDVIGYVLETAGLKDCLDQVTMVGDRKDDILGAKANGIRSIGVLYGFGSREELEAAGADKIAETVQSIIEQAG